MKVFNLMTVPKKEVICKMHRTESHPGSNRNAIVHIRFWDQGKRIITKCTGLWYGLGFGIVILVLFFTFFVCVWGFVWLGLLGGVVCLLFLSGGFSFFGVVFVWFFDWLFLLYCFAFMSKKD